jgi:hypothetical protein
MLLFGVFGVENGAELAPIPSIVALADECRFAAVLQLPMGESECRPVSLKH